MEDLKFKRISIPKDYKISELAVNEDDNCGVILFEKLKRRK